MKTKKKEDTPSRFFTRGEKVTGKRGHHHGRRSTEKKEEPSPYDQVRNNEEVPTA
jgi:hypothetical protein